MNNSIEITLNGEKKRLKFNQGALEVYRKTILNIPVEVIATGVVYACIYAGLFGDCFVKQIDPTFTYEDVCDWVDEADAVELKAACDCFAATTAYQRTEKDIQKAIENITLEEKKNVS